MGRAGHEAVRRDHNDATEAAKLAGLLATVVGAGGEPC
jgi:hypothetical protein